MWLLSGAALAAIPTRAELDETWRSYAHDFVTTDGRVVDKRMSDATTSEGQAYAMLRAVWIGDRTRFLAIRRWTQDNLQAGDATALPAWKWGRAETGEWGVLDANPASDADQLIAYALLLGAQRWQRPELRAQAIAILGRVWESEVTTAGPRLVMAPGPWAVGKTPLRVNPSYFLPFAWRAFAQVDPAHDWIRLLDDGYALLGEMTMAGLPPDWAWLDANGAVVAPPAGSEDLGNFGFEAIRLPWALAADVEWFAEGRARALLARLDPLRATWTETGAIRARLTPAGEPLVDWSWLGTYGALLPAWQLSNPEDAERLYIGEIVPKRTSTGWGEPDDYYAQNWIWFGLALWSDVARPVAP